MAANPIDVLADHNDGNNSAKDQELLDRALRHFKEAMDAFGDWRGEAATDFAFRSGDQWDDEDLAKLEEQGRPHITFNRIEPVIDAVAGLELVNRQEVRYIPRELGDTKINELLTEAAKWARDNCDAEDEESEAFLDAVTCGMGWVETRMDYETEPDGQIVMERRDPLAMLWDPSSTMNNLRDRNWQMYISDMDRDVFDATWPDADISGKGPWDGIEWEPDKEPHDATEAYLYEKDQSGNRRQTDPVRVVVYQWREREPYYRVADPNTGVIVAFSEQRYRATKDKLDRMGVKAVKQSRWTYKQAFFAGRTVLERGPSPCKYDFTFHVITGKRDRNKNTWYGIVRAMRDPNRWSNKFFGEILEIIQAGSKGGLLLESGAAQNPRELEDKWADPRGVIILNNGAISQKRMMERRQSQYPQGLDRLLQFAISSIPEVTGVNMELLGLAGKVQPGILEAQRKQAGLTILGRMFNSLRRYRKEQGRALLYFIQTYISDGRLIRIMGRDGARYVPLLKDPQIREYDVVVDDSPNAPNQKEKVWTLISELLPFLASAGVPLPPDVFDYIPLPQSLAQKWKEMLTGPNTPEARQEQAKVKAMQERNAQAEIDEKESKATKNYADAQYKTAQAAAENRQISKSE